MKIKATPADSPRLVLTREAAKVVGCSMGNMRWLARTKRLKSWVLGPRSLAFDLDECLAYRSSQASIRAAAKKAGKRARGNEPQGFAPDVYRGSKR